MQFKNTLFTYVVTFTNILYFFIWLKVTPSVHLFKPKGFPLAFIIGQVYY